MRTTNASLMALKFDNANASSINGLMAECVFLDVSYNYWNELYWNNFSHRLILSLYGKLHGFTFYDAK